MDRLWAPWRIKYIAAASLKNTQKIKKCIFCAANEPSNRDYLIFKSPYSLCILNIFPYNNGHLMISPKRHISDIAVLKEAEILDLFQSLNKAKKLLHKVLKPDGYNIGINLSRVSGAGIPNHLHIHIVPRWLGDVNFMPVIHNTKVISQSLKELQKLLKNADAKTD